MSVSFFVGKRMCGENVSRKRKIKNSYEMEELWKEYKEYCDNKMVLTHDFSSKNSEFVSKELKKSVTYTIEGFCVFAGISRQAFYEYYAKNKKYVDIVTRMREECEVDAREKFELSLIPSQLAGLWMSKYGYTNKLDTETEAQKQALNKIDDLIEAIDNAAKQ